MPQDPVFVSCAHASRGFGAGRTYSRPLGRGVNARPCMGGNARERSVYAGLRVRAGNSVLLGDLAPQGNKTKQICLIAIVVTASILEIIIPALLYRLGGPMVEDTIGVSKFIGADDFVTNNQALLFGFLYSSDAYIFGRDLLNTETIAHIVELCGWILGGMFVIWNLPRLKRHWDGSLLDRILIASIVILTLACIFSEEFTFALGGDVFNGGRCKIYISPLIILSAVLVARAIPTAEAWLPMKTLRSMARNGLVVLAASLLMLRSPTF